MADDKQSLRRNYLTAGALLGMLAVILGAMAAHALKAKLSPSQMSSFETAVRYQFFHALLFLLLGNMRDFPGTARAKTIFALLLGGILLFSGSIYLLSTIDLSGIRQLRVLGPVTPIGGVLMIVAWGMLAFTFYTSKSNP